MVQHPKSARAGESYWEFQRRCNRDLNRTWTAIPSLPTMRTKQIPRSFREVRAKYVTVFKERTLDIEQLVRDLGD